MQQATNIENPALIQLVENIQAMDRPKFQPEDLRAAVTPCVCGKILTVTPEMQFHTGAIPAVDNLCPDCRKDYAGTAKVVCVVCRPARVVARVAPGKDPKTGLVFSADRIYHIDGCPGCKPGLTRSILVEQAILLKKQGKKI